jgi:hypothetical protein
MIGQWERYDTVGESYMRRRFLWVFWQYRALTDDEARKRVPQ